jgi:hypothetical protein
MVPLVLLLLAFGGMALLLAPVWHATPSKDVCKVSDVTPGRLKCGDAVVKASEKPTDEEKAILERIKKGAFLKLESVQAGKQLPDIVVAKASARPFRDAMPFIATSFLAFMILLSGLSADGFRMLFVGVDNRLSNSKVQGMMWLSAIVITWSWAYYIRLASGMTYDVAMAVVIPENLLALAGISGATAAAAKVVTEKKAENAPVAAAIAKAAAPSAADLTRNSKGETDIGDTQMIAVTALTILAYVANAVAQLEELSLNGEVKLPEPTGALVLMFGGSLGGYLLKKMIGKFGEA